jgi:hypothetical protein
MLLIFSAPSSAVPSQTGVPPKPAINLAGAMIYQASGKDWVRHWYIVRNSAKFPADMFAIAPDLPPCGRNSNASRSWVDFYDSTGKRLYGFCALKKAADLRCLWFATELGTNPPGKVYIELTDRRIDKKYRSNLAKTGPSRPTAAASAAANAAAARAGCSFAERKI